MKDVSPHYEKLSPELEERIREDRARHTVPAVACPSSQALRRDPTRDRENLWRPAFSRDTDKILHSAFYSRYADKTQVFSFYRNDDMTRRALHVQLVSRIARNIGNVLGLDADLIEAIALGHDIGHTPFGHAGEKLLSALYHGNTGRYFNHNVHSVRVLDGIFPYNISLPTLSGILAHNGEIEQAVYRPAPLADFADFDLQTEMCYTEKDGSLRVAPSTLEGCIVRISDIIAYLGKDRQDAVRAGLLPEKGSFAGGRIGSNNAEIINNLTVNIIEHSYGQDHIEMDADHFAALSDAKRENYEKIYMSPAIRRLNDAVAPMMEKLYGVLRREAEERDPRSLFFRHHVATVNEARRYYGGAPYEEITSPDDMTVDFIASMTDDYFTDLFDHYFPGDPCHVRYVGYFDGVSED